MKRLVISLTAGMLILGFAQKVYALGTCTEGSRIENFDPKLTKLKKYENKQKPKRALDGELGWFAGGWGPDGFEGNVPSGSTIPQNFGLSLWPFHGDVNYDWVSLSFSCQGDNCATVKNKGNNEAYVCNKEGTTTISAQGVYRDSHGNFIPLGPTNYQINCVNAVPIATFNLDNGTFYAGNMIQLTSTSADPDGYNPYQLTHTWSITEAPPGSVATFVNAGKNDRQFTPDLPGIYKITLVVDDCIKTSEPYTQTIEVLPADRCQDLSQPGVAKVGARKFDSSGQTCVNTPLMNSLNNPLNTKCAQCSLGLPVNISTGSTWHETVDFRVPGRTPDTGLTMDRLYVANAAAPAGDFGPNWRHTYETILVEGAANLAGHNIQWIDENGGPWLFIRQPDTSLKAPISSQVVLTEFSDHYELKKKNATVLFFSRTPFGKLTKITERHGESVTLSYGSGGLLESVSAPFAGTIAFTRNEQSKIATVTRVRDNLTYTYAYDDHGRLASVTDFSGHAYSYTYVSNMPGTFANGLLETITDPLGRVAKLAYDSNGRALEQTEAGGGKWKFNYNTITAAPHTTIVNEVDGSTKIYSFDFAYRGSAIEKVDGGKSWTIFGSTGFLQKFLDELGFQTSYSYDANGNMTSVKRPEDSAATQLQYDPIFNKPILITPAIGAPTRFTLDSTTGDVLQSKQTTSAGILALDFTNDAFGNSLSVNNGITTYGNQRDANGLLTTSFDLHNPVTLAHDARGRITTRTFQSGRVLQYTYDNYDRPLTVTDSAGPGSAFTYDAMGRMLTSVVTDGRRPQTTSYTWDDSDRLLTQTDALGRTTKYAYDSARILKGPSNVTDPAGRVTRFEYDTLGRLTKKTDPRGAATKFAYNIRGDLTSVTDANGNITSYQYDGNGRKSAETRPSMQGTTAVAQTTNFFYDAADNLTEVSHGSTSSLFPRIEDFQYDDLNRLIKKTLQNAGSINEANFTYEPQLDAKLLKTVVNENVSLNFSHETAPPFSNTAFSQNAVTSGNPFGLIEDSFTIQRDVTGNIASVVGITSGNIYSKSYDPAGRLLNVDAGPLKTALAYDGFGRKTKLANSTGEAETVAYDSLNRTTKILWKENGKNSVGEQLTYDLAGNVSRLARENAAYDLHYDETDQLISSRTKAQSGVPDYNRDFQYDLLGNRTGDSLNGTSDSFVSNFLLRNGVSSFEADPYGFGEVAKETTAEQVKNYNYRADGKIAAFQSGDLKVSYLYDGLDRLAAKLINQNGISYAQSYVQLSEENRVLMGKAGDGSVTAYIDGQGVAEHLGEVKAGAGKAYITDHLGSVLNSPLTGSGKAYGLYGEANSKLGVSQTSIPVAYGFAGYKFDSESGNYSTPNRIYNPSVGRWLSQDPIGFNSKDSNYYRYVKNSPLLYSDPSGKNRRAAIVGCTLMMGGMTSLGLSKYQRSQNTENWMWYGGAGAVLVGAGIILGDQYLNNDAAQYGPLTPAEQSDQNTLDNLQQQLDNMTGQDGGGDGA